MRRRKEERIEIHERLIIRAASGSFPAPKHTATYRDALTLNEVVQQHYHARTVMKKIILLFIGSFLVTAVFSASLKVFFQEVSWREVLIKGLVIPCFTWTVQLLLSAVFLKAGDRLTYWNRLGWVCLIGSIALLPAAFYNLRSATPWVWISMFLAGKNSCKEASPFVPRTNSRLSETRLCLKSR